MVKDSVDKTQEELLEEMAKALGHTGSLLESVLLELKEVETLMRQAASIEEYNCFMDKYNSLRNLALTRREMLIIHREAIGMRRHTYIDTCYPIPGKKRKRS
jgi:hypothetical protein